VEAPANTGRLPTRLKPGVAGRDFYGFLKHVETKEDENDGISSLRPAEVEVLSKAVYMISRDYAVNSGSSCSGLTFNKS